MRRSPPDVTANVWGPPAGIAGSSARQRPAASAVVAPTVVARDAWPHLEQPASPTAPGESRYRAAGHLLQVFVSVSMYQPDLHSQASSGPAVVLTPRASHVQSATAVLPAGADAYLPQLVHSFASTRPAFALNVLFGHLTQARVVWSIQ